MSTWLVRALAEVAMQHGVSQRALFEAEAERMWHDDAEPTWSRLNFQTLLERATMLTGEPDFGLRCGLQASSSSFGLMTPLIAHVPTLRHALDLIVRFQGLLVQDLRLQLTESGDCTRLHCELQARGTADRSFAEWVVAGLVRTLRVFACQPGEIQATCFQHARPSYHQVYSTAFESVVRFEQPYTGVELSSEALDRPHLHHNLELSSLAIGEAQRRLLQQSQHPSFAQRVLGLFYGLPGSSLPNMDDAARALGVSMRTLRRRLELEQTTYRALTRKLRQEHARAHRRESRVFDASSPDLSR